MFWKFKHLQVSNCAELEEEIRNLPECTPEEEIRNLPECTLARKNNKLSKHISRPHQALPTKLSPLQNGIQLKNIFGE